MHLCERPPRTCDVRCDHTHAHTHDHSAKIIAVMGTPFLEWTLASTAVIANPDLHGKFLSPNPESFKVPGVEYVFGKVSTSSAVRLGQV